MSATSSSIRTAAELRRAFLDYFKSQGHTEVPSSPLVPNDPTLLFTTAGMVQFKSYYTATGDLPYTRAVSVQKCLRLTDLDNVGITPRHDTFFEMLGNFSFGAREKGAYFKEEAVAYAWEFVTKVLGMPKDRLYPSVFEGEGTLPRDDEAIALWKKMGVPESRIVPLGRKDNFWGPAGGAGACGPCSEIYFDLGEPRPDYLAPGAFWGERPGDPGDRFMEFWNLVFPQFDASPDGELTPLARPGIDTGMGIERLSLIMQGKNIIFETDVFEPMVKAVLERGTGKPADAKAALRDARIIADHVRALTFAIAEGALPGNEGAGYVLRRLLRRAVTRGRSRGGLAIHSTFLAACAEKSIDIFGGHYRELGDQRGQILRVLEHEEAGFAETFEAGIARLEKLLGAGGKRLDGREAFALHDTYGFPIELTEEIAGERGIAVDREEFDRGMDEQRERARAASKFGRSAEARAAWTGVTSGADSEFLGYTATSADGMTLRRWREADGGLFEAVFDRTPCYAESGGQVADRGTVVAGGTTAELAHVYKEGDAIVHRLRVATGTRETFLAVAAQAKARADVSVSHRAPTERHHTATHLLHAALRGTLGTHVKQAGSLVAPDRLRFDYSHFEATSPAQVAEIECIIDRWVAARRSVSWKVMPIAEARAQGAMALFGEKYGAEVRMVTVDGVSEAHIEPSRELCGGTHVKNTGDIGAFLVVSESAIAAGVRRLEARCGAEAVEHLRGEILALADRDIAEIRKLHEQVTGLGGRADRWARVVTDEYRAGLTAKSDALVAGTGRLGAADVVRAQRSYLEAMSRETGKEIESLRAELATLRKAHAEAARGGLESEMARLVTEASSSGDSRWIVALIQSEAEANAVRDAADQLRGALKRGGAVLAVKSGDKLTFVAAVTDDLVAEKKLNASDLVKKVAQVTGGSGGGKPHLALAGGKDASKLDAALDEARRLMTEALS
ncbi:MAG: alanine--tRNA ligase [Candidatus Eisenbacteria bacterium]